MDNEFCKTVNGNRSVNSACTFFCENRGCSIGNTPKHCESNSGADLEDQIALSNEGAYDPEID
jgi:hypothetical protein